LLYCKMPLFFCFSKGHYFAVSWNALPLFPEQKNAKQASLAVL
jgi:hypothetical protein